MSIAIVYELSIVERQLATVMTVSDLQSSLVREFEIMLCSSQSFPPLATCKTQAGDSGVLVNDQRGKGRWFDL